MTPVSFTTADVCYCQPDGVGHPSCPMHGSGAITFSGDGDFEALDKARAWCRENGYSVGALQADAPTGLAYGDAAISKWRNLSRGEKQLLDGIMDAPGRTYRTGPVTIRVTRHRGERIAQ